ncbi:MAG: chemotaxis protein CheX [Thermodesulfobacteriota bacterium]|nr:chemotaxis protein CheX [Thermodesulfobacteriota bacterium]
MDVKLINPFIEATVNVLETMAFTKSSSGKPYLKKDNVAKGDVSGVIGLTGEATGAVSVSFTAPCILGLVSSMFGETIAEMDDEVKDAVGEITNMISGQARQKLEGMGKSLKAAIPTVITGKDHTITHITNNPIVAIPFTTDSGEFTIEVYLE